MRIQEATQLSKSDLELLVNLRAHAERVTFGLELDDEKADTLERVLARRARILASRGKWD